MAATHSPTLSWLESPIFSAGKSFASIFTTAISVCLSVPRTLPSNSRLSVRRTTILSAPSTTCAFVRMSPSVEIMKPDPVPRCSGISCSPPPKGIGNPKRRKISAPCSSMPGKPKFGTATVRAFFVTDMFTTPAPLSSTSLTKSGSCPCVCCCAGVLSAACTGRAADVSAKAAQSAAAKEVFERICIALIRYRCARKRFEKKLWSSFFELWDVASMLKTEVV